MIDDVAVVVATVQAPPEALGVTHWSARLLGKHLGISFASVARIWREWNLQPWSHPRGNSVVPHSWQMTIDISAALERCAALAAHLTRWRAFTSDSLTVLTEVHALLFTRRCQNRFCRVGALSFSTMFFVMYSGTALK